MAEVLKKLAITEPLKDTIESKTEYINVEMFRKVKITTHSDVMLQVYVEFSPDGENEGVKNMYRIASDSWTCQEFITQMSYMRIRLVNNTGINNKKVFVQVIPVKYNEIAYEAEKNAKRESITQVQSSASELATAASALHDDVVDSDKPVDSPRKSEDRHRDKEAIDKKKSRFKSPFSRSHRDSKSKSSLDYRLPQIIPEGAILVGGKLGKITFLHKGEPGDVLAVGEDGDLIWKKVFFPDKSSNPPSRIPPPLCPTNTNTPSSSPSISFSLSKIDPESN